MSLPVQPPAVYDSKESFGVQGWSQSVFRWLKAMVLDGWTITNTTLSTSTLVNPTSTSQTLTDGATISWDCSLGEVATLTLTASGHTLAAPTNMKVASYILHVKQDATGGRTMSWNTVFKWPLGTTPVLSTAASAHDVFVFVCDGTNMYGSYLKGVA